MSNKLKNLKLRILFEIRNSGLEIPRRSRGMYLPVILMASVIFIAFATAIISLSMSNLKMATLHNKRITSMSIAEAGVNYYLWHLAHSNTDYCDGVTCPTVGGDGSFGPFTHEYKDGSGNTLGSYDLFITPPRSGSSVTTVKSVGKVFGTNTTRTVITTIGMPSFTKYTLLVNNSELWIGSSEKVEGSVFVNKNGVRNDGEVTKDLSSTEENYTSHMFGGSHPGIWGEGVVDGTKYSPVPTIDFTQLNVDILSIRNKAKNELEGDYYPSSGSGNFGYHVILKADSYEVKTVKKYGSVDLGIVTESAGTSYSYPSTTYPSAGVIFFEDNVWVEGTVNNHQVTIVAANTESGQKKRIIIPGDIKYTNYDGKDKIGLITQTDILVVKNTPTPDLEIDAAMIAKDGEIKINDYNEKKNSIKVYGSMAHNTGLIWTYCYNPPTCTNYSGYKTTQTVMDEHNVLNPPPKFPLTGTYAILSWREE